MTKCNLRLSDFYTGALSPRLLWVAIRHLPTDGALAWSLDPDRAEAARWGATDYVLADLYDLTLRAAGGKDFTYPRPGEVVEARRRREERNRWLEEQAERNRLRDAETGVTHG